MTFRRLLYVEVIVLAGLLLIGPYKHLNGEEIHLKAAEITPNLVENATNLGEQSEGLNGAYIKEGQEQIKVLELLKSDHAKQCKVAKKHQPIIGRVDKIIPMLARYVSQTSDVRKKHVEALKELKESSLSNEEKYKRLKAMQKENSALYRIRENNNLRLGVIRDEFEAALEEDGISADMSSLPSAT